MKAREFLDKHIWTILTIISIIAAILAIVFIRIDASRNIEDQINSLYEKERLVEQDFRHVYNMSGVSCDINNENNVVVFRANDCSLKVKYSKTGEVLTKEFEDSRIGTSFFESAFLVFSVFGSTFFTFMFALWGLDVILARAENKICAKKQGQSNTDTVT